MKKQYGFYLEMDRCIDCWSCQVACKQWHGIKAGTSTRRRVIDIWGGKFPDVTRTFFSMACMHCAKPACEAVCPTGAISKRVDDGIVVVDKSKCIGCHFCFFACPFGIPQYDEEGTMDKCNFCIGDTKQDGELPCVATCPTKALHAGTMEELSKLAAEKAAGKLAGATQPSMIFSN